MERTQSTTSTAAVDVDDAPAERGHRLEQVSLRALVLAMAATALVARLAYWLLATRDRPLNSDAAQYHFLASNLAEGKGFVDYYPQLELHATAFRPPAYPFLLSLVYRVLWPSPGIGRAVNVALGVGVVVVLVVLVDRHLGRRAALAAGLVAALLPNLLANDTYVLTEPLSLLLVLGVLWMLLERRWELAAVLAGVLVLTRPSAQYLIVALVIYVVWRGGWRRALAFALLALVVVAPWVLRNWAQLGSPVLVTSNGFNYAAIYSPPADENDGFIDPTQHPYFEETRWDQFDEVVWDRNLRKVATDHVKERPEVVVESVWRNFGALLEVTPSLNEAPDALDGRSAGVRDATFWLMWPLVAAGVWGAVRRRREPIVVLAGIVGIYFWVASLVFVAPPRLRSPSELMLIIAAAALLAPGRAPVATAEPDGAAAG